jgi:abequosyltransferase
MMSMGLMRLNKKDCSPRWQTICRLSAASSSSAAYGTVFIHVGVVFQSSLPGPTLVLAQPHIMIRYGNASWTARAFQIWAFNWPELIWSFPQFSDEAKRKVCVREPWRSLKWFLLARAQATFDLARYHEWYEPRLSSSKEKRLAQLIARLPGVFVNSAALLYFRWFIPQDRLSPMDLRASPFYFRRYFGLPNSKA